MATLALLSAQPVRQILRQAFEALPRGEQTRIADDLGVRVQTVNKWAKGYNAPGPDVDLRRLEELLHLDPGALGYVAGTTPIDDSELRGRVAKLEREVGLLLKWAKKDAAHGAPWPRQSAGGTP